jgi:hypothetical protein
VRAVRAVKASCHSESLHQTRATRHGIGGNHPGLSRVGGADCMKKNPKYTRPCLTVTFASV